MIQALVIKRFKANGRATNIETARPLDLPAVPHRGVMLSFPDGTTVGVCEVLMRCTRSPPPARVYPASLAVRTATGRNPRGP